MQTVNLIQGSPEWHAHRRNHFNASDAPAMMGVSKYRTRDQVLHEYATGIFKEADSKTQKIFDDGHKFEALARPMAERIIGADLSPTVGVDGKFSASFDGITFDGDVIFEHKTLNAELNDVFHNQDGDTVELPLMYRVQMEQQLMLSGAEKCLFMGSKWVKVNHATEHYVTLDEHGKIIPALSSGVVEYYEFEKEHHCWYYPDLELRAKIIAGWAQFETDLVANYVPPKSQAMPQAEVVMSLPSLFINAKAEITASNMAEYGDALKKRMQEVRSIVLVSDQDFSNAKASAKQLRDGMSQAKQALDAMTAQNTTFDEAKRMVESWIEDMRVTALKLEKDIDEEDKKKKRLMISVAQDQYQKHLEDLAEGTHPIRIPNNNPDFAGAIKGKKNYDSMQSAVNALLANSKAVANQIDMDIRAKQTWMKQFDEYSNLFPDLQTIIFKPIDDFKLVIESRINTQKAKDLEAKAKAEAEARARMEAEQRLKGLADAQAILDARAEAQPINGAKPEVAQSEATPSRQDQVSEKQSSPAPTELEQALKQTFVSTKEKPNREQIVSLVADHYGVSNHQARGWLNDLFYAMAA